MLHTLLVSCLRVSSWKVSRLDSFLVFHNLIFTKFLKVFCTIMRYVLFCAPNIHNVYHIAFKENNFILPRNILRYLTSSRAHIILVWDNRICKYALLLHRALAISIVLSGQMRCLYDWWRLWNRWFLPLLCVPIYYLNA